jgi:hypothetical protein
MSGDLATAEVDSPSVRSVNFPTQSDAETWIGEQWRDLLQSGVNAVVLVLDGAPVYGPMDLHPVS